MTRGGRSAILRAMNPRDSTAGRSGRRHGVARVLSKRGLCSRTQAAAWVRDGRVAVNGRVVLDPEFPVRADVDRVDVDGRGIDAAERVCIALNKPRGLVTTARDERGRATVYDCLRDAGLPWLGPVGRLDQASEGLLLLSNDPAWAAAITDPARGPDKTYHVQVDGVPDAGALARLQAGRDVDGERLAAKSARLLRSGGRTAWLEIVLDEGRNRQIRRLLAAEGWTVRRLVRVAIGPVALGDLAKGAWRRLGDAEIAALAAD
jgi:23S rRNA pseudouridine2605 synthase